MEIKEVLTRVWEKWFRRIMDEKKRKKRHEKTVKLYNIRKENEKKDNDKGKKYKG